MDVNDVSDEGSKRQELWHDVVVIRGDGAAAKSDRVDLDLYWQSNQATHLGYVSFGPPITRHRKGGYGDQNAEGFLLRVHYITGHLASSPIWNKSESHSCSPYMSGVPDHAVIHRSTFFHSHPPTRDSPTARSPAHSPAHAMKRTHNSHPSR